MKKSSATTIAFDGTLLNAEKDYMKLLSRSFAIRLKLLKTHNDYKDEIANSKGDESGVLDDPDETVYSKDMLFNVSLEYAHDSKFRNSPSLISYAKKLLCEKPETPIHLLENVMRGIRRYTMDVTLPHHERRRVHIQVPEGMGILLQFSKVEIL